MKPISFLCLTLVVFAFGSRAAGAPPAASQSGSDAAVHIPAPATELAKGYAQAFAALSRPPFTLTLQKHAKLFVLEDVKGVREFNGVLLVEVGKGLSYLVNALDVVSITDGTPIKTVK